jgi:uroporphyrinogen-III synthase
MKLIITRPAPAADDFAAAIRRLGAEPILSPALQIRESDEDLDLAGAGGLAFTSANGVRAFARRSARRDLRVFAVGAATAAAARAAGFASVDSADGDVRSLATLIAGTKPSGDVLHLAGRDRAGDLVALLQVAGVGARRSILYQADEIPEMAAAAAAALRAAPAEIAVSFFSPRAAESFLSQAARAGVGDRLRRAAAYCLSPAVAAAAGPDWARIKTARVPTRDGLLALIAEEAADGRGVPSLR